MGSSHKNCLVLNADYSPIGIINWQRAITWSIKYTDRKSKPIEIIELYRDDMIKSTTGYLKLPAVIRLSKYFKFGNCRVNFSRKNIFIRDNYMCQYCGLKFSINDLTYDHVIPKSAWCKKTSPTSWDNIVTACGKCNRQKSNRTPQQAKMKLLNYPIEPAKTIKYLPVMCYLSKISNVPSEWEIYVSSYL